MALAATPTAAQATPDHPAADWTEQHPAHSPSARLAPTAYDAANGTVVLFGSPNFPDNGVFLHDTWTWNGHDWTLRHPKHHPPGRGLPDLAYDPARRNVVLFGGVTGTPQDPQVHDDTWTWNGTDWTEQHPADSPPGRFAFPLVTDPATNGILLFGGAGPGFALLNDTWTWDGRDWTQRHPVITPEPDSSMASDPATHTVVAFGGGSPFNPTTPLVDSTWTWDGTNWTLQNPAHRPSPRAGAATSFDRAAGNVVLFSGSIGPFATNDETWTWDGTDWTQQNPADSPPPRGVTAMTTDPATCSVVLFGGEDATFTGLGDTWVYASAQHPEDQPLWHDRCDGDREATSRSTLK
jgi:hypothetical protein